MTQFEGKIIIVNGYNLSERFGFNSYTIKNTSDKVFGANRSLETEPSLFGENYLVNLKNDTITLDIELAKVDKYGNTAKISDNDLDELARMLFKNKECELQVDGLNYYGVFINGTSWRNGANHGFVCLQYQLILPYAYSRIYVAKKHITTDKVIEITNKSNAEDYTFLDIEIIQRGNTPIKIHNMTTNESIVVNDLIANQEVVIKSATKEIYDPNNIDKNMFGNIVYKKNFLRLRYGTNRLRVEGNCIVQFSYQAKMYLK